MIKKVSVCLHLLGVSSPSSAPQQLSVRQQQLWQIWAALVFCKAAALLVVETQKRCNIIAKPTRQEKTSAD